MRAKCCSLHSHRDKGHNKSAQCSDQE